MDTWAFHQYARSPSIDGRLVGETTRAILARCGVLEGGGNFDLGTCLGSNTGAALTSASKFAMIGQGTGNTTCASGSDFLLIDSGNNKVSLAIQGSHTTADFTTGSDGGTGTLIQTTLQPAPSQSPAGGSLPDCASAEPASEISKAKPPTKIFIVSLQACASKRANCR